MEGDGDDADFASYALRAPGEVAGVKTKSAILLVPTTSADKMDTLGADSSIGRLATFLKSSALSQMCFFNPRDIFSYLFLR